MRGRNYVNVIVAGKQPQPQWLVIDAAIKHCTSGIGSCEWTSNDKGTEPDVVMACCGDVPFTTDEPIIFVYHGYPWLIHRLTYRRTNNEPPCPGA